MVVASLVTVSSFAQNIDEANSMVEFDVGNMGIMSVDGTIKGMKGEVNFDPANPSAASFDVCIDPSTIHTGNDGRDDHLKNEDFFHITKYLTVCFKSSSVSKTDGGYLAQGKLTILETTSDVAIPFTYADNTLVGEFELNRMDYGLGESIGTFIAGKKVEVTITCKLK